MKYIHVYICAISYVYTFIFIYINMYHIDTLTSHITHMVRYGHDSNWYYDHYHLLCVSISFYACVVSTYLKNISQLG